MRAGSNQGPNWRHLRPRAGGSVERTRIVTGLAVLALAVLLLVLGVWYAAIGILLGAVLGIGVVGHRFTRPDHHGDRFRQAHRFLDRTRTRAVVIVGIGFVLMVVGVWLPVVLVFGVGWIVEWVTAVVMALSGVTQAERVHEAVVEDVAAPVDGGGQQRHGFRILTGDRESVG